MSTLTENDLLDYLAAFNNRDYEKMRTYFQPDVALELPGKRILSGPDSIRAFYLDLHSSVRELLSLDFLMINANHIAIELYTEFRAFDGRPRFSFGPLVAGDVYRCTNMVHYDLRDDLFANIRVGSYRVWEDDERREPKVYPGLPDES